MCICVSARVSTRVYVHAWTRVLMHERLHRLKRTRMCYIKIYTWTKKHTNSLSEDCSLLEFVCVLVYIYTHTIYIYSCVCAYVYTYTHTERRLRYVCVCECVHICIYHTSICMIKESIYTSMKKLHSSWPHV